MTDISWSPVIEKTTTSWIAVITTHAKERISHLYLYKCYCNGQKSIPPQSPQQPLQPSQSPQPLQYAFVQLCSTKQFDCEIRGSVWKTPECLLCLFSRHELFLIALHSAQSTIQDLICLNPSDAISTRQHTMTTRRPHTHSVAVSSVSWLTTPHMNKTISHGQFEEKEQEESLSLIVSSVGLLLVYSWEWQLLSTSIDSSNRINNSHHYSTNNRSITWSNFSVRQLLYAGAALRSIHPTHDQQFLIGITDSNISMYDESAAARQDTNNEGIQSLEIAENSTPRDFPVQLDNLFTMVHVNNHG